MKSILRIAAAVALIGVAAPAIAADAIVDIPQPPIAVVDDFSWTGAYVGVQAGYIDADVSDDFLLPNNDFAEVDGFIGGVHVGYDYDFGAFVLGAYADVDFSYDNIDLNNTTIAIGEVNYIARGMVRAGADFGRVLAYAQGGLAYADADIPGNVSGDADGFGYAVGAGIDYAMTDNIILGADYLYHDFSDFGDDTTQFNGPGIDVDAHTFRAKLSYKF